MDDDMLYLQDVVVLLFRVFILGFLSRDTLADLTSKIAFHSLTLLSARDIALIASAQYKQDAPTGVLHDCDFINFYAVRSASILDHASPSEPDHLITLSHHAR
jgi:hypothetical protein